MEIVIEKLSISGDELSHAYGEIYELLGLNVVYRKDVLEVFNTEKAKMNFVNSNLHVHTHHDVLISLLAKGFICDKKCEAPFEITDMIGNRIIVVFNRRRSMRRMVIVTSGGDAPGMNSTIKSVVKTGIKSGAIVYGAYGGYGGLVDDNIHKLNLGMEIHSSDQGGTVLLSARSEKFMSKHCRKQAVLNLMRRGINCIVVLGGNGSLSGALALSDEFEEHFREIINEKIVSLEDIRKLYFGSAGESYIDFEDISFGENGCYGLKVIGVPATIDNDIHGADVSLGGNTAICRVVEAIDHLVSTMRSHSRVFVVEVMGGKCGWIALMSALASAADYVLLPEAPTGWRTEMIEVLLTAKKCGKQEIFVIVAESAIEADGTPISSTHVLNEIDKANIEVRLLKLGHVQRGGPTSALDRIYGTLLGVKIVEKAFCPMNEPIMISMVGNKLKETSLKEVVKKNKMVEKFQNEAKFKEVFAHRSSFFGLAYTCFRKFMIAKDCTSLKKNEGTTSIGILQSGCMCGGINTALNAVVQYAFCAGMEPHYIKNGFEGLLMDKIFKARTYEFFNEVNGGGSAIGTGVHEKIDSSVVQRKLKEHNLSSLIVIGDSKALLVVEKLCDINIVFIPASSFNNIPGTDVSIGVDTALNAILKPSDVLKQNFSTCKNNVFVTEVGGEHCGYLSLMGGIAAGAFEVFVPEREHLMYHLSETVERLRKMFEKTPEKQGTIIFRNETTFCSVSTESFCKMMKTDNCGTFETEISTLGQLQQQLENPSPVDRINATILGIKAVDLCVERCGVGVIGIVNNEIVFTEIETVMNDFDRKYNCVKTKNSHWLEYIDIFKSIE